MSVFVGAWPDTHSCITFREAAAEAATLLVSSQNGGDESRYVQEGGCSESVWSHSLPGTAGGEEIGCGLIRRIQSINISSLLALQIRFSSLKHDLRTGHRLLAWAAIIRRTGVKTSLYPCRRADILQFSASLNTCGNHSTNVHIIPACTPGKTQREPCPTCLNSGTRSCTGTTLHFHGLSV